MASLSLVLLLLQDKLLPPILVTSARSEQPQSASPASVQVLTAEDLERTGERSLPRAIGKAAGVGVWVQETNLGGGAPILRGSIGPQVLIVVDGVRLNDSTTRLGPNQSLNTIDPAIVERVELLRGPAAVPYGSDAVGGVLLIWTKRRGPLAEAGAAALQGSLEAEYQSTTTGARGAGELSWAGPADGVLGIGSLFDWNDLHSADEEQEFTGYHGNGVFGSWVHRFDDWRSLRISSRIHRDFDVPRTDRLVTGYGQTQPSNSVFDFQVQDSQGTVLEWEDRESRAFADRVQLRGFLRNYREERLQVATGSTTERFEQDDILGYGVGFDLVKGLGEHQLLRYGLDFERDQVDSSRTNKTAGISTPGTPAFAENSRYWSSGAFLTDEILGLDPWQVTLGARYSYFGFSFDPFSGGAQEDGNFNALTGSFQVSRRLNDSLRTTATLAQSFRAPHLDDLAKNSTIFGGEEFANPDLDPEVALSGELAFDYDDRVWSGTFAGWHTGISDAIGRRLIDDGGTPATGDDDYLRDNVGRVELYGVELRVARQLGDSEAPFALESGLAWTRGRQYDNTINPGTGEATYNDVPARRIPPLQASLALAYEAPTGSEHLDWGRLELNVASKQDELNPDDKTDPRINPNGTPGWAVVDLDLGGRLGDQSSRARWSFGLHNLLDQQYRVHGSGLDAPGLGAVVGLRWSY